MGRATKPKSVPAAATKAAAGRPGSLKGRVVICSLNHRNGRWLVADDDGGELVRLTRPGTNLSTWETRASLTAV